MEKNIKSYSLEELEALMKEFGQPSFRAKQLYEWLHVHLAGSYEDMTNLPRSLRDSLAERFPLASFKIVDERISSDGTRKYVLGLNDDEETETVGLPEGPIDDPDRLTVCFSTQVGCPMGCAFCATGHEGFTRNLTADEMMQQIYLVQNEFGCRVSNIVAMGQGEPFLNYTELMETLRKLNDPQGLNIGARHMTISTCGIIDGIHKLSEEPEQFTLAISLHSAIQWKRNSLMPHVSSQPLTDLKDSLLHYIDRTNRRVTLEYLLLDGINDGEDDLDALIEFCDGLLCHINLLPMNTIDASSYRASSPQTFSYWKRSLKENGIETTVRRSRGSDIAGACGQLKNEING